MVLQSSEYWKRRMELLEEAMLKKGEDYLVDLDDQYRKASAKIEREISKWYNRFAVNNEITMLEAKKILTTLELKEFKWDVEDYIKYGMENAKNKLWMKELENASARVHVSRLEALKLQMQQQVEVLYGNQTDDIDELLRDIYSEDYYHTAYEIQKGFNVGYDLQAININQLTKVISKPWTMDGKTFSDRLWTNKQLLVGNLQTYLTQSVITGKSPGEIIRTISDQLNVDKKKAGRLVMTESAAFASAGQRDAYIDLDVERYEIVATLDLNTSNICQGLDGKICDMADFQIGVTANPFHPNCRSTTIPYFDDNFGERAARGIDGKTYYVPSDMTYKEWYQKHMVEKHGKEAIELIQIKNKNATSDKKLYDKYKELLGKDVSKTFADFQEMKYTDNNKWIQMKSDYRYKNNLSKREIVKISDTSGSLPLKSKPNSIKDLVSDNGKIKQRRVYDETGKIDKDIDTSDHGKPKYHKTGAHAHDYDHDKKISHGKPRKLTSDELRLNNDIIKEGDNYNANED